MRALAIFCFIFAAISLGPRTVRADWAEVKARGELGWGGDLQGGEPYVYESPTERGKIVGFEVDIAEALAKELGVRARFHQNDWSNLIPSLERGDFDVIMNGLEDTPARRSRLHLSRPYFVYGETLAVKKGSPLHSLDELSGKRVGTLNQTVAQDLLVAHHADVALYEGQQEPYMDLAHGRLQGVLLDHVIADRYGCPLPEIQCVPEDMARGSYVIGIRSNEDELAAHIDAALGALITRGDLRQILEKWKLWDARQDELSARERAAAAAQAAEAAKLAEQAKATHRTVQSLEQPQKARLTGLQLALFFQGALITILISVCAFGIALPFGVVLAVVRSHAGRAAQFFASAYIEIFRGTPVLLQLYVLYYGLSSFVRLSPIVAAILGLGLNYAAYEAEVHRGALNALPRGQTEAASSLGLSRLQVLRHVLLPQSLRIALPALTNDFVALLKDSSLVSVITVVELTKRMTIVAVEARDWVMPGLLCAALYFAMSFPLSRLSLWLERRYQSS